MQIFIAVIIIIISYLIGSISFSYLVGKYFAGIDIRQHGSGNAGASNTLRILGNKAGFAVLFLDLLKGVFVILLARWFTSGEPIILILAGISVILGHNWPIYFNFKGGKGVATTIGVVATMMFKPFIIAAILGILVIVFTRYISLASMVFAVLLCFFLIIFKYDLSYIFFAGLLTALIFYRHTDNIKRLLAGQESKLSFKRGGN